MRQEQRDWVHSIIQATGLSLTALAKEAGLSDTTLTRFMNGRDYSGLLTATSIAALTDRWGMAPTPLRPETLDEETNGPDALPFAADESAAHGEAILRLVAGRRDASSWRVTGETLRLAGVQRGDILIIDRSAEPRSGDVVCVQVEQGRGAQTVFRIYDAPFAIAATVTPGKIKPLLINNETVRIAGVMTEMLRLRAA